MSNSVEEKRMENSIFSIEEDEFSLEEISTEFLLSVEDDSLLRKELDGVGNDLDKCIEKVHTKLFNLEKLTISDYIGEKQKLEDLRKEVNECEMSLSEIRKIVLGLQDRLGQVSLNLNELEKKSTNLNQLRVRNWKLSEKMSLYLRKLVLSPHFIQKLFLDLVNETFIPILLELNEKYNFVVSKLKEIEEKENKEGNSDEEDNPSTTIFGSTNFLEQYRSMILSRLVEKSCERVFKFFESQMDEFNNQIGGKENNQSNSQYLKQTLLMPFRFMLVFVKKHNKHYYERLQEKYIQIFTRYYAENFRTYTKSLLPFMDLSLFEHQKRHYVARNDVKLSRKREGFLFLLNKRAVKSRMTQKEKRKSDYISSSEIVISQHVKKGEKIGFEDLFKSLLILLVDCVSSEYVFGLEFFVLPPGPSLNEFLLEIFRNIYLFIKNDVVIEYYLNQSLNDILGILIMIRLLENYENFMGRKRRILPTCLSAFFGEMLQLLWPRFKYLFGIHLSSVRSIKVNEVLVEELEKHSVIQRYASFISSIHKILISRNKRSEEDDEDDYSDDDDDDDDEEEEEEEEGEEEDDDDEDGYNNSLERDDFQTLRKKKLKKKGEEERRKRKTKKGEVASAMLGIRKRKNFSMMAKGYQLEQVLLINMESMRKAIQSFLKRIIRRVSSSTSSPLKGSGDGMGRDGFSSSSSSSSSSKSVVSLNRTERIIFLINSYDLIICSLLNFQIYDSISGKFFREKLEYQVNLFVDILLKNYFSDIISFTKLNETLYKENKDTVDVRTYAKVDKVQSIDIAFQNRWKTELVEIFKKNLKSFHNKKLAVEITKKIKSQLSLYYGRFFVLIKRIWKSKNPLNNNEFGPQHIMRFKPEKLLNVNKKRRKKK